MSGPNREKRMAGAMELKKACVSLLNSNDAMMFETSAEHRAEIKKNLSSPIIIERNGDVLTVGKQTDKESTDNIEFQFKFRLLFIENKAEWWPVGFTDNTGRAIEAEVQMGNRVLTNVQKQNELIELSNTWAKSISSQHLTRTIEGII